MTVKQRARRNWMIGVAGAVLGAVLIAIRNPQVLSANLGQLLIFGLSCWLVSLVRPKWAAIIFGGIAAILSFLGYGAMQSGSDSEVMAGMMIFLIGIQTAMATSVAVIGNLLLDRLADGDTQTP